MRWRKEESMMRGCARWNMGLSLHWFSQHVEGWETLCTGHHPSLLTTCIFERRPVRSRVVQEAHQSKRMRSWTTYGIAYACTRVVLTAASFLASDPRPSPFNAVFSVQPGGCAGCVAIPAKVAHAQLFRACSCVLYYCKLNGGGLGSKASSFPPGNWFCVALTAARLVVPRPLGNGI